MKSELFDREKQKSQVEVDKYVLDFLGEMKVETQDDLIKLRTEAGVDKLLPGITGWAQVNGRDGISISDKVELDIEYMFKQSFWFDIKILWLTLLRVINKDGVSH